MPGAKGGGREGRMCACEGPPRASGGLRGPPGAMFVVPERCCVCSCADVGVLAVRSYESFVDATVGQNRVKDP